MMDDLSPNLRLETFWNCLDERQKHVTFKILYSNAGKEVIEKVKK